MNRDYSQQRHHRPPSRFDVSERYQAGRASRDNPPRYEPSTGREREAMKNRTNFPHRQTAFATEAY